MKNLQIVIGRNGRTEFIYSDELIGMLKHGKAVTRRASHVEPEVSGGWTADMAPVGGPKLGPFPSRAAALLAEEEWIKKEHFHI